MAALINLRQARKDRARAEARAKGDENAAKSGRTKAEKKLEAARAEKARAAFEAHKRE